MSMNLLLSGALTTNQQIFGVLVMLGSAVLVYWMYKRAEGGYRPYLRRLPAFDGIDYVIDRCAELGKPVYVETSGTTRATDSSMLAAAISMMPYIAERCAAKDVKLFQGHHAPQLVPSMRGVLDRAAETAGKPGYFEAGTLHFLGSSMVGPFVGLELVESNDCRANIILGRVSLQVLMHVEANKQRGCISVIGSGYMNQIHAIGLYADYTLIMEEMYAAAAYLTGDPEDGAILRIQDMLKAGILGFFLLAVGAIAAGISL